MHIYLTVRRQGIDVSATFLSVGHNLCSASFLQPLTVEMGQLRVVGDAPSGASGPSTLEQGPDLSGSGGPQVAQVEVGSNGGN